MSLQATLQLTGSGHDPGREWVLVHSYPRYAEPIRNIVTYKVKGFRRSGNGAFAPDPASGLVMDWVRDTDNWQAYKQGGYLIAESEHEGTATSEPIPPPRVRGTTEIRYHDGVWQKYLKRSGWVPA